MKFVGLDGLSHFWSKAKAYTDTQVGTETACRKASDTLCTSCSYKCASTVGENACAYAVSCSSSIGTACKTSACNSAIAMDALCLACSYACGKSVCTSAISRENTCLSCAYACVNSVCCNTINRDALCLACAKAYTDTKALCSCSFAVTCSNNIGTSCKNAACSFAVTCSNNIGTSCKNAAMATKANCYGNSYNCVEYAHKAINVIVSSYSWPTERPIYIGNPTDMSGNIGCNANLWFCPTCNVLTIGGSSGSSGSYGSAICLTGAGSSSMAGDGSRLNPSIVFATIDKQCACLQYNQYDSVHPGAGLCLATNTTNAWFDTDCVFANKFINRNGCQIGGYCVTIPSPNGVERYVLLDFGAPEGVAYFSSHNNEGTIVKACASKPYGAIYAQTVYGIYGYYSLGTEATPNNCFWIKISAYRNIYLWSKSPIKVLSNTTTNPGCTWQGPNIKPTCDYVSTVAGQCKSAACTYANTVAGQCKSAACTYAGSIGTACKNAACAFAVTCGNAIGTSCKNAACAFAAACAASVVPETSTFAKCYGKSTSCVECAHKVRLNAFSSNVYYKIPFTSTTGKTSTSGCLVVGTYPSYNPNSQVSCVYTECVAKTLAVPNGNGCLRLGSYCIYIG